jgi:hypothetical protein
LELQQQQAAQVRQAQLESAAARLTAITRIPQQQEQEEHKKVSLNEQEYYSKYVSDS